MNPPRERKKGKWVRREEGRRITTQPDWNSKSLFCSVFRSYSLHMPEAVNQSFGTSEEGLLPSGLTHLTASCWLLKRAPIRLTLIILGKAWRWADSQGLFVQKFTQGFCREWPQLRALLIPLNWFTSALSGRWGGWWEGHLLSCGLQRDSYSLTLL